MGAEAPEELDRYLQGSSGDIEHDICFAWEEINITSFVSQEHEEEQGQGMRRPVVSDLQGVESGEDKEQHIYMVTTSLPSQIYLLVALEHLPTDIDATFGTYHHEDPIEAVRIWAEDYLRHNRQTNGQAQLLTLRRGPFTEKYPQRPGAVYQPGIGWGVGQLVSVTILHRGDGLLDPHAVHEMSDQELNALLALTRRPHAEPGCMAAVRQLLRRPQDQNDIDTKDAQAIRDEEVAANTMDYVCRPQQSEEGNTRAPKDCSVDSIRRQATGYLQQSQQGTFLANLHADDLQLLVDLCADAAMQAESRPETSNTSHTSKPEPEPIAGPSGLCRQRASEALKPVRAKFSRKRRPLSEIVDDLHQAICSRARGAAPDPADPDRPAPIEATEVCIQAVDNIVGVFDEQEGERSLLEYVKRSDEFERDLCHEPGVSEYLLSPGLNTESDMKEPDAETQTETPPTSIGREQARRQWRQFAQQAQQQFDVSEQQLRMYMDNGPVFLVQNHPGIFGLLQQMYPALMDPWDELNRAGFHFTSCLPDDENFSSRRMRARADHDDLCRKLLAAMVELDTPNSHDEQSSTANPGASSTREPPPKDVKAVSTSAAPSKAETLIELAIGIPLVAGGLAALVLSPEGTALLVTIGEGLGITSEMSLGEGMATALAQLRGTLARAIRQAIQRVLARVSRFGHRVANPLLRQITSRALRSAAERAGEHIPLLAFSG
ncbi:deuterolysin metalloprotease [Metarhizium rileyi]|uniref:Deuterolysin metalloprotease n=1 Tax=Metarhizium rileyi (strain RCEF 4871) TaxID=1649241 RepID=A0A166WIL5_METRR|nr:deuterolysin metalloprotease [Metarhizium rileyi RCEF 4871]